MGKARNRAHATDLDLPYLKELWEKQQGMCPLSGITMELPVNLLAWTRDKGNCWKPSLDRIDSSKGYVRGNVRYIVNIANMCQQSWGDVEVVAFCKAVAQHQG